MEECFRQVAYEVHLVDGQIEILTFFLKTPCLSNVLFFHCSLLSGCDNSQHSLAEKKFSYSKVLFRKGHKTLLLRTPNKASTSEYKSDPKGWTVRM